MSKVWAFGCSHVRGTELGVGKYMNTDQWLMDNFGTTNIIEFTKSQTEILQNKWHDILLKLWDETDLLDYEMTQSYSGQVADILGYELHNKGIRGSGADRAFHEFLKVKDDIDWNKDIVFVGFTYPYRYMFEEDQNDRNRNLNWMATSNQKGYKEFYEGMLQWGPTDFSWASWSAGLYHMIKLHYPTVHMIDATGMLNPKMKPFMDKIKSNDKTLKDFSKYDIVDDNKVYDLYPQYHFKEYAHKNFAEYLITELNL